MELRHYIDIVRRRWPPVLALPLLALLVSLAAGLAEPPVYGLTVRLLVTRGDPGNDSRAGLNASDEDETSLDVPTVISGAPFQRDVAAELARRGRPLDPTAIERGLSAITGGHLVLLSARAASPADAEAMAEAAVLALRANGLRYWADPGPAPRDPGLNVAVLSGPQTAERLNGLRPLAADVAIRTLIGLLAGIGLAFLWHYLAGAAARPER